DKLLLRVRGAPLAPVHVSSSDPLPRLSIKSTPIIRDIVCAVYTSTVHCCFRWTEASKLSKNAYAMGKLKMITSEL
ncbi:hypothetical protein HID58_025456, partial [Brassica napus]